MRKYIIVAAVFLLATLPGAISDWLSLYDRFFGNTEEPVMVSVADWYSAGFPLLAFAVLMFGIWWTRRNKVAEPILSPDTQAISTNYDQRYADWMSTAIQDDVSDLPGCITVNELPICWEHLEEGEDAYIEFNFDIWSSSVHLLEISKQVEGHIYYRAGELERIPEITQKASQLNQLRRSRSAKLIIRQWLSFPVKVRMKTEYGSQIEFDFSQVNISVVATLPDGSQGSTCRLPIPNVIHAQMPNHPDAPVPDKEGSQN